MAVQVFWRLVLLQYHYYCAHFELFWEGLLFEDLVRVVRMGVISAEAGLKCSDVMLKRSVAFLFFNLLKCLMIFSVVIYPTSCTVPIAWYIMSRIIICLHDLSIFIVKFGLYIGFDSSSMYWVQPSGWETPLSKVINQATYPPVVQLMTIQHHTWSSTIWPIHL